MASSGYSDHELAEIMANLGFAQRFGMGIALSRRALSENGNPEPDFQVEHSRVRVIVEAAR